MKGLTFVQTIIEEVKNDKEIGNENCHASKILKNFMFDSKFNLFNKNDF